MQMIWEKEHPLTELSLLAQEIVKELGEKPFCLWLEGEVGAGKTTLTGFLLRNIGLSSGVPVTSPTFTYCNDYEIGGKKYGHCDLYRLTESTFLEEILDLSEFHGLIIEWPQGFDFHLMKATHKLSIYRGANQEFRKYSFFSS